MLTSTKPVHHDEASAKGGGCFEIETDNGHADPTSGCDCVPHFLERRSFFARCRRVLLRDFDEGEVLIAFAIDGGT